MGLKKPSRKEQKQRLKARKKELIAAAGDLAAAAKEYLTLDGSGLGAKLKNIGSVINCLVAAEERIDEAEKIHV